jgi:hypothetical protein
MSCDVPNGGRLKIIVMNPFDPNGVRLEVDIPDELGKETVVASLDVEETQPSFRLWKTNSMPINKSRCALQCVASPEEITADTSYTLDHHLRKMKNI